MSNQPEAIAQTAGLLDEAGFKERLNTIFIAANLTEAAPRRSIMQNRIIGRGLLVLAGVTAIASQALGFNSSPAMAAPNVPGIERVIAGQGNEVHAQLNAEQTARETGITKKIAENPTLTTETYKIFTDEKATLPGPIEAGLTSMNHGASAWDHYPRTIEGAKKQGQDLLSGKGPFSAKDGEVARAGHPLLKISQEMTDKLAAGDYSKMTIKTLIVNSPEYKNITYNNGGVAALEVLRTNIGEDDAFQIIAFTHADGTVETIMARLDCGGTGAQVFEFVQVPAVVTPAPAPAPAPRVPETTTTTVAQPTTTTSTTLPTTTSSSTSSTSTTSTTLPVVSTTTSTTRPSSTTSTSTSTTSTTRPSVTTTTTHQPTTTSTSTTLATTTTSTTNLGPKPPVTQPPGEVSTTRPPVTSPPTPKQPTTTINRPPEGTTTTMNTVPATTVVTIAPGPGRTSTTLNQD